MIRLENDVVVVSSLLDDHLALLFQPADDVYDALLRLFHILQSYIGSDLQAQSYWYYSFVLSNYYDQSLQN